MKRALVSWLLVTATLTLASCAAPPGAETGDPADPREAMRAFISGISAYAKARAPGFLVIPQNGEELLTLDGTPKDPLMAGYLAAIDGLGREDLLYGYEGDDLPTPPAETERMAPLLDLAERKGLQVLVIDYASRPSSVDDAYTRNAGRGYVAFVADDRGLRTIPAYPPAPFRAHAGDVRSLALARNVLYLLNPASPTRERFLDALRSTDYDVLILDLFFWEEALRPEEVASLKEKANGGRRLVLCYLSIGEAEDYRFYWAPTWVKDPPPWLLGENPDWEGNYLVRYWDPDWQRILFGGEGSYLDRIQGAGFDGVYLDLVDAYQRFEE